MNPATRRGRARRDAGSSRSAAGARRRRWWWQRRQREPRDRSITGSHGARTFSSLGAGARLGTRPRGERGSRRPGRSGGRRGRAREPRGELASSSQPAGCLGTALLPRPGGRGPRAAAAAVVVAAPFAVAAAARRGWCSDCSRRRSKKWEVGLVGGGAGRGSGRASGEEGAVVVVTSALPELLSIPRLSRHQERRDQRPNAKGGGSSESRPRRRRRRRGGGVAEERREDGVCACAPALQT